MPVFLHYPGTVGKTRCLRSMCYLELLNGARVPAVMHDILERIQCKERGEACMRLENHGLFFVGLFERCSPNKEAETNTVLPYPAVSSSFPSSQAPNQPRTAQTCRGTKALPSRPISPYVQNNHTHAKRLHRRAPHPRAMSLAIATLRSKKNQTIPWLSQCQIASQTTQAFS